MNVDRLEQGEKVVLAGAMVVVFGALLPWSSETGFAASGLAGNGSFTLVFALLAAALVAMGEWTRETHLAVMGLGVLTALIALAALPSVAAIAGGLYVTIAGGGTVAVGGGLGYAIWSVHEATAEPAD